MVDISRMLLTCKIIFELNRLMELIYVLLENFSHLRAKVTSSPLITCRHIVATMYVPGATDALLAAASSFREQT